MKKILLILLTLTIFISCSSDESPTSSATITYLDENILGKWIETEPFYDTTWCDTVTFATDSMAFSENQWGSAIKIWGDGDRKFYAVDGWIGNTFTGNSDFQSYAMYAYEINNDTLSLWFLNGGERVETTVQHFYQK